MGGPWPARAVMERRRARRKGLCCGEWGRGWHGGGGGSAGGEGQDVLPALWSCLPLQRC